MVERGEVTLIEAVGRPASLLPLAGAEALGRARLVVADPAVHPSVLWLAPQAEVVLRPWDEDAAALAQSEAEAGAAVVVLIRALASAPRPRAPGVAIRELRGVTETDGEPRGPLAGRRILVTRPRASAVAQRERFEALGADAVALPCLQIEPPEDLATLDAAVAEVGDFDGLILSSRNGVDAFFTSLDRVGLDARALHGKTVVAVGRSTARACRRAGIRPDVVPDQPRSEGIVSALAQRDLLGQRWLHVRGRDGRDTVDVAVTAAGGRYVLAVGYRAERPEPPPGVIAWLRRGVDLICLHSGKTGENLREILARADALEVLEGASVVSAGPVTTEALQEQGFEVAATAVSPDDDGMLQAVLELGQPEARATS